MALYKKRIIFMIISKVNVIYLSSCMQNYDNQPYNHINKSYEDEFAFWNSDLEEMAAYLFIIIIQQSYPRFWHDYSNQKQSSKNGYGAVLY